MSCTEQLIVLKEIKGEDSNMAEYIKISSKLGINVKLRSLMLLMSSNEKLFIEIPNLVKQEIILKNKKGSLRWEVYSQRIGFPPAEDQPTKYYSENFDAYFMWMIHMLEEFKIEDQRTKELQLTGLEQKILDKSAELWNMLIKLPEEHPQDNLEFSRDIHNIQYRVMSRPMRRQRNV